MVDLNTAVGIIKLNRPYGTIQKVIEHDGLFIFQVFTNLPLEDELDPFFFVNKTSGEFGPFSLAAYPAMPVISEKFLKTKRFST